MDWFLDRKVYIGMRDTNNDKECYIGYEKVQTSNKRLIFNCDVPTGDVFWIEKMPASRTGRDEYTIGFDNCPLYLKEDTEGNTRPEFRCGGEKQDRFYIMQDGFANKDPHPYQIGFLDETRDCPLTHWQYKFGIFSCDKHASANSNGFSYFIRKGIS